MAEIDSLAPPRWMSARSTRRLIAALTGNGQTVRFVGGCVRDAILKKPAKDIDLATPDRPEIVMNLLKKAKIRAVPTGIKHGTVTAILGKQSFEITTLRRDVETDGRRAVVAFTDDWTEDAKRRDFTMNAIYANPDGSLFDPMHGVADAKAGRVRFVGDAAERIREDYLRILRLFRFYAHYGQEKLDKNELKACQSAASHIASLSGERVRDEFLKLLSAPNPIPVLNLMQEYQILDAVLPGVKKWNMLQGLLPHESKPDPVRRLMALIVENNLSTVKAADRFKLSNAQRQRLDQAMSAYASLSIPENDAAQGRVIYQIGSDAYRDLLLLWAARQAIDSQKLRQGLQAIDAWRHKEFPLSGEDAMALGLPQGPKIGQILSEAENWWVAENFTPDRNACLGQLRKLAGLA